MMRTLSLLLLTGLAGSAFAQGPMVPFRPPGQEPEPIPVALALQDMVAAYSSGPTAEVVTVKATLRTADRNESMTQSFVVRLNPDPEGGALREALLELGNLRAYFGDGRLLVTSTAAPEMYYSAEYEPPLTAGTIASLLPPVPAPQLALAAGGDQPITLTPYSPGVVFATASAFTRARPPFMTLSGASHYGPVSLTADVQTGRILRFTCETARPQPSIIELTCRVLDPGETESWRPRVDERERVLSLADLRPTPPLPLRVGDRAPEITLSRPELGVWSLRAALAAAPEQSVALVFWRWSAEPELARLAARDAAAGLKALQALGAGSAGVDLLVVPAVVIELGEYSGAALESAVATWVGERPGSEPGEEQRRLLWSNSAARSIEPFSAGAHAVAVVVGPDRVIRAIVPLDAAAENGQELARTVRELLTPAPVPAPAPEPVAPSPTPLAPDSDPEHP